MFHLHLCTTPLQSCQNMPLATKFISLFSLLSMIAKKSSMVLLQLHHKEKLNFSIFLYLNILLAHLCLDAQQLTLFFHLQCLSVSWTEPYQQVTMCQQHLVCHCCFIWMETFLTCADSYAVLDRDHHTRFKWEKFKV